MLPSVSVSELDGALGISNVASGPMMVLLGVSSSGTTNAPAAYARAKDITSAFGSGPTVEAAAYAIERYGKPVVFLRAETVTAGSYGELDDSSVAGTSTITLDAATHPFDDYEAGILFVAGGTRGTAGITYQWTLDGGRTLSAVTALGTATSITIPGSGGVKVDLGAGTIVAGDAVSFLCIAPAWDSSALSDALDALAAARINWEFVLIVGELDATDAGTVDAKLTSMHGDGKHRWAIGSARIPTVGETEAAYKTAMDAEYGDFTSTSLALCAGASKQLSSLSRRSYRRPVSMSAAPRIASVSEEVDVAELDLGALPGVSIRDANGNPDEHDEANNPGLDDSRFLTLRTWEGREGVFVTNPRIIAPTGSDFIFVQFRRVMNIARTTLETYLVNRLSKAIRVDKKTGFIREEDARDIESGANAALRSKLLKKPKASAVAFTLSRTDDILSTLTLTGQCRVVPLGYPKAIEVEVGFNNPALRVSAA